MGFFSSLFGRKKEYSFDDIETDWDRVQSEKEDLNLKDPAVREEYVRTCLDQMQVASEEMDKLTNEYAVVTSYLTDMEEIEAIPKDEKKEIERIATHLSELRKNHDSYVLKESRMTTKEYNKMDALDEDVNEAVKKILAEEDYRDKVKKDLKKVDREKRAYDIRQSELSADIVNFRGIAIIAIAAAAVLVILLFLLQALLDMDVKIGYYITVALIAVALTFIYLKYVDSTSEKRKVDRTINELILLENKVKIRYVNNRNLLDYYYLKYDISSGEELKSLYERYLLEREDRRKYESNESVYLDETAKLVRSLRRYRITDPDIWLNQSEALVDSREMVEIRHKLISRRQKLRKQMEYNQTIASESSDEIKEVMARYPESKNTILMMIDAYEKGEFASKKTEPDDLKTEAEG